MNSIEKAQHKKNLEVAAQKKKPSDSSISKSQLVTDKSPVENVQISQVKPAISDGIVSNKKILIDFDMLEGKGFVSTNMQRRIINEEYRVIKRKLLNNAFGSLSHSLKNSNIIMVTSSRPGEGKTFTAVNLALSIALEQDKTVLLVDADVLRPNVMKTLELENKQGLMEYLLGEKENIAEVMCRTNLDNLRIITAGKSHHLSTELLASQRMFDAVEEFANRYTDRVVIVDTPPMLGITETAILANLAGQAIIVAEENKTKLVDIEKAVNQLNPDMAIGFVVNKSDKDTSESANYGYYYAGAD